jgi:hypothetical protein
MTVRHATAEPLAAAAAAAKPGHVGAGAGLVDEDEPARVKRSLALFPTLARFGHVRPVLLRRVQGFLKLMPWRSKNRHTALRLPAIASLRIAATTSSKVRSGWPATSASSHSECSSNSDLQPPLGFAAALPV